jgi:hypothetical protein
MWISKFFSGYKVTSVFTAVWHLIQISHVSLLRGSFLWQPEIGSNFIKGPAPSCASLPLFRKRDKKWRYGRFSCAIRFFTLLLKIEAKTKWDSNLKRNCHSTFPVPLAPIGHGHSNYTLTFTLRRSYHTSFCCNKYGFWITFKKLKTSNFLIALHAIF